MWFHMLIYYKWEVDLNHLESLITPSTILVSIPVVDSELGIKQPMGRLLKC